MRRALKLRRDERGLTLAELLVQTSLAMIVLALVVYSVVAIHRSARVSDQDSDTLATMRSSIDRIERELRHARTVYEESTGLRIRFWVDRDRDNQQDAVERIIWQMRAGSGGGELIRTTEAVGAPVDIVSRDMVFDSGFAYFTYDAIPHDEAYKIGITLRADAVPGGNTPERQMQTEVRLRNALAS